MLLYMLLRFQEAAVQKNYETGNQAVSMRWRFLTIRDLRMFDPNDRSPKPRLVFRPEKLRELGIPDALIEAAAKSEPRGFLLFDDLPGETQQGSSQADQPPIKT